MSALNLQTIRGYKIFLHSHLVALKTLAHSFRKRDIEDFSNMIEALERDVLNVGSNFIFENKNSEAMTAPLHGLGVAYVVRGSRHGAKIIKTTIPGEFSVEFLSILPMLNWADFIIELNDSKSEINSISASARLAFEQFITSTARQTNSNEFI